jgi:hypothetical protein
LIRGHSRKQEGKGDERAQGRRRGLLLQDVLLVVIVGSKREAGSR